MYRQIRTCIVLDWRLEYFLEIDGEIVDGHCSTDSVGELGIEGAGGGACNSEQLNFESIVKVQEEKRCL